MTTASPAPPPARTMNTEGFSALQRFTLYETAGNIFIVGSDKARTAFRILIIDRSSIYKLEMIEDPYVYPPTAIVARMKQLIDRGGFPLDHHFTFHGILGFFALPKLHLALIVKKSKVGSIGSRWVYGIDEWSLFPVQPRSQAERDTGRRHHDTNKCKELIVQHIDLTKDFYFSYFYDLTHSLQHNLTSKKNRTNANTGNNSASTTASHSRSDSVVSGVGDGETLSINVNDSSVDSAAAVSGDRKDKLLSFNSVLDVLHSPMNNTATSAGAATSPPPPASPSPTTPSTAQPQSSSITGATSPFHDLDSSFAAAAKAPPAHGGLPKSPPGNSKLNTAAASTMLPSPPPRSHPFNSQFLWNLWPAYLCLSVLPNSSYWLVPVIHGFFAQQLIRIGHTDLLVTLIARRSRHYAGTRYIKRGINAQGHVANEVESEQILEMIDNKSTWFSTGSSFASTVLLRGSIPLYWWQENVYSMKPNIVIATDQEQYKATKVHFDDLCDRYGPFIDVLSLIKQRERNQQETRLGFAYTQAIAAMRDQYGDDQLRRVEYQTYDFINMRAAKANVLRDVRNLVGKAVEAIGIFSQVTVVEPANGREHHNDSAVTCASDLVQRERKHTRISLQRGVIRVNCVDCLDRTNVAQFCVGKASMKYQLQALGLLNKDVKDENKIYPELLQILQHFFTRHGDRIAQQYAGSGAMHRDALYDKDPANEDADGEMRDLISGGVGEATRDRIDKERDQSQGARPPTAEAVKPGSGQSHAAGMAHNTISFVKRYYANNVSDVEKQQAINLFLGHYIPSIDARKPAVWDTDASTPMMDFDLLVKDSGDFFYACYDPSSLGEPINKPRGTHVTSEMKQAFQAQLAKRFNAFFEEKYNPTKLTSLEQELSKQYRKPVYISSEMTQLTSSQSAANAQAQSQSAAVSIPVATAVPSTPSLTSLSGNRSHSPSPYLNPLSSSVSSINGLPLLPLLDEVDSPRDLDDSNPVSPPNSLPSRDGLDGHWKGSPPPAAFFGTPPASPSPQSLSRQSSMDPGSPMSHSYSNIVRSPSNSLSQPPSPAHHSMLSPQSRQAEGAFTFDRAHTGVHPVAQPVNTATSSANKSLAAATKAAQATKSFFTKGLKALGKSKADQPVVSAGSSHANNAMLHRVRSSGNVHTVNNHTAAVSASAQLSGSKSQEFSSTGQESHSSGVSGSGLPTAAPVTIGQSPRKQPPVPRSGQQPLPNSGSFTATTPRHSVSPQPQSAISVFDDLLTGMLPSSSVILYPHDSPHAKHAMASKQAQQDREAQAWQTHLERANKLKIDTSGAINGQSALSPLTTQSTLELFHSYLDTERLCQPIHNETSWTEQFHKQQQQQKSVSDIAGASVGDGVSQPVSITSTMDFIDSMTSTQRSSVNDDPSSQLSQTTSVDDNPSEEFVSSTLPVKEDIHTAEVNQSLESAGVDALAAQSEVPGNSDQEALAKLAGEMQE